MCTAIFLLVEGSSKPILCRTMQWPGPTNAVKLERGGIVGTWVGLGTVRSIKKMTVMDGMTTCNYLTVFQVK